MSPGPVKRYRARSRNRALGNQQRTELREKALEMAQKGLNRRGGPVDQGSPQAQKQAADKLKSERAQNLGEMQREKQVAGRAPQADQKQRFAGLSRALNRSGNSRSGQMFQRVPAKGGEIHRYAGGRQVFVRKPAASRTTGATEGTYNRQKPASRGSQDLANQLAQRRVTENRPKARRKLFARG
jgi:hypothetical protein